MTGSAQIAFLDMRPSVPVRDAVQTRVRELARVFHRLEKCRVLVEAPHDHGPRQAPLYGVRIRLSFPDDDLAVEVLPHEEDVYDVIRNGFETARRKLEEYEFRRREDPYAGRGRNRRSSRGSRKAEGA